MDSAKKGRKDAKKCVEVAPWPSALKRCPFFSLPPGFHMLAMSSMCTRQVLTYGTEIANLTHPETQVLNRVNYHNEKHISESNRNKVEHRIKEI